MARRTPISGSSSPIPTLPPTQTTPAGDLLFGRWAGRLRSDPLAGGPSRGRARRWLYAAAGDERAGVGAAVVVLGPLAVTFVWASAAGRTITWETRVPLRRQTWVSRVPQGGAGATLRTGRVAIGGDGSLDVDIPVATDGTMEGRLQATVTVSRDAEPVVLVTRTPTGGWNCTQKAAGYPVTGHLTFADSVSHELAADAGGFRDWTSGRQDRTTVWRWAAAAGCSTDGRRVGINLSSGMNARDQGEDVAWWDGVPAPLPAHTLRPVSESDPSEGWELAGPGWGLSFTAEGLRAKHERLPLITSRYVMPIGRFDGTLPGPDGAPVEVTLHGVTEDHLAIW